MPQLAILIAYRNRDLSRVRRFMDSLSSQTFQDFEVIFTDYGSDSETATEARKLCAEYAFCTYHYIDSRGTYWNKSRALNHGLTQSNSQYILSTDVDLIFSKNVLQNAIRSVKDGVHLISRVYFLPQAFKEYVSLGDKPIHFEVSSSDGVGGFLVSSRASFIEIGGYDEYYMIWGFEDKDIVRRLGNSGLNTQWLSHEDFPIYHQWHPRNSVHRSNYPIQWWDDMSIHYAADNHTPRKASWPKFSGRSIIDSQAANVISLGSELNPFDRAKAIEEINAYLIQNTNSVLEVRIQKNTRKASSGSYALNSLNRVLKMCGLPLKIQGAMSSPRASSVQFMHYFILRTLVSSDLISDYYIDTSAHDTVFRLESTNPNNTSSVIS